ncbi:hypothetical protein L207DRAFT_586728 [Hyaloscypha variabilis F]|uniref:Peptidase C14 caspase domain-containing protein n=1 Tax=Hyaloscypha variabilis (strain UAMH 11265 / GT02V1 / F) TaxID=1149755 RepID=A0A2J6REV2_HYAVF|nr:hypothetical protein L207DRAFT_586728 [Hyaloscypha variabilis F]
MATSNGFWEATEEQPKPAVNVVEWGVPGGKNNGSEINYDGWGILEEHSKPIVNKRGWKTVFSRKSGHIMKKEIYSTNHEKSASDSQLLKHAREKEYKHPDGIIRINESLMPAVESSNTPSPEKQPDNDVGEANGSGWRDGDKTWEVKHKNREWGVWSVPEDIRSYQETVLDNNGTNAENHGDQEIEEPSDQDVYIPPFPPERPIWKNRTVQDSPYKERFEALVAQGWLTSGEIVLLQTSQGRDLITHLRHFELSAQTRASERLSIEARGSHNAAKDYPYSSVHVLLLQWEEDDLGVDRVVEELKTVFKDMFGFESAEAFRIPSKRPYVALETRLQDFKQQYSSEQNLLIIHYAGHGYLDQQNRMHWAAKSLLPCPTLDWYALQVGLERTLSDVLILLDACCSAGASNHVSELNSNQGGRTEIIVASGFDQNTSGQSFTTALIGELRRMAKTDPEYEKCMSAAQLHQRLLASMLHQSLPKEEDPGVMVTSIHRFSTPVYISLSKDHNMPSIPLKRFRDRPLEPLSVPSMVFETRKLSDSPAMKVKRQSAYVASEASIHAPGG